ncbi:acetylglutamate synthase Arg6 [Schizosaccharomyces japonicus yFS275]|uniref:Amino-acid acetyltransferase, mitochondrial n=1 Tax=Schizosaccharomyces japonicus (strain yFS275 / FY16936) TaxID=402676 RepID=NAGS_SCHJY|nr:acetylglutamate synthase Arg6 [Schizosaccharomyces japonicus yFS275]B6JWC1.1 RecName: Full=Amino-acid acetyltransferase, mitochondrial; AltName: Full=Arginine-requiring protein 2; AltName: Full=Glutamate N-acetyltransferase; AltName: Full=N-acetylglutamate synthase; Short=AGS; Short=NAGS; Flags: Precursor [Schizosaccharomyces japonicus yFS275]EEB05672.1 acetylglutamate synthase Arg6 [Schizosaccharomyces japonicus yFS275]
MTPKSAALVDDLVSILKSVQTKRSAKGFLKKLFPQPNEDATPSSTHQAPPVRLAVTKLAGVETIADDTLFGIGKTIQRMSRLGMQSIIVPSMSTPTGLSACFASGKCASLAQVNELREQLRTQELSQLDRVSDILCQAGVLARPSYGTLYASNADGVSLEAQRLLLETLQNGYTSVIGNSVVNPGLCLTQITPDQVVLGVVRSFAQMKSNVSVERLIVIDEVGGMPCPRRSHGSSHVLINLAQEYVSLWPTLSPKHAENLQLVNSCLDLLPHSAAAIVTTPDAAVFNGSTRQSHPIIHNILTDRTVFSCSLPVDRSPETKTTLLRRGTPIYMYHGTDCLTNGSVSWDRIWYLLNDSFQRVFDMPRYLERIRHNLALVIVAGDYEGVAIITLEQPQTPGAAPVPYLDKLAVLQKVQGTSAIADFVFNAMCSVFSQEIVWRSRLDNPVNKWYFERSRGSLLSRSTPWRLFWTGYKSADQKRIQEYLDVIDSIQPTWIK